MLTIPIRTDARTKSISGLLSGQKYAIDYYQREYLWERRHVQELMEDLQNHFLRHYRPTDERTAVERYPHYFLGSIVVCNRNGSHYIIDGQQRLTTITLLLMYLHSLQKNRSDAVNVAPMIYSEKFGQKSFNLGMPDRTAVFDALYNGEAIDATGKGTSAENIVDRYNDIVELFQDELRNGALPYFVDWLVESVDLVEITAFSDEEAYTIFETMNDRGLSLSPADMLKGYLLANIRQEDDRDFLNRLWQIRVRELNDAGIDDVSDFFKSWLRGRHAKSIRGSKPGEENKDWERIVTAFHKWVREERESIGLDTSADFERFIKRDFDFYSRQYALLRKAAASFQEARQNGLESVHYNANNGFTLQYPLILSALNANDSPDIVRRKTRVVASFLDIFIARRFVNFKTTAGEATKNRVFNWIAATRSLDLDGIVDYYLDRIAEMDSQSETFDGVRDFYMHQQNKQRVHHILARLTDAVEVWSGSESNFDKYSSTKARTRYEVEHIWSEHFEEHDDEFETEAAFQPYRNRIGGLVLLPRGTNQSYGGQPYSVKLKHYIKDNLLVQSLHPDAYERNPNFVKAIERRNLPFAPHPEFRKKDLDRRQCLYQRLCEEIWSPERLLRELDA